MNCCSLGSGKKAPATDEVLVPLRIELDMDGYKLREVFTWNLHGMLTYSDGRKTIDLAIPLEPDITPEMFAGTICEDYDIPASTFLPAIAGSIRSQLEEYRTFHELFPEETDARTVIELDISVGNTFLRDRFEWELGNNAAGIERFARQLCADLGLSSEFPRLVAHSIHEQLYWQKRLRVMSPAAEPAETLSIPVRDEVMSQDWGPSVDTLTEAELERIQQGKEREARFVRTFGASESCTKEVVDAFAENRRNSDRCVHPPRWEIAIATIVLLLV